MLPFRFLLVALGLLVLWASPASAELLALLNYESKPDQPVRREGIAIMEIDPESADFGKILMEIPLPSDLVAHHIFFNRDRSKAYITALGKSILHVVDLTSFPIGCARLMCRIARSARISWCRKITGPGTSPAWVRAR